VLKTQREAWLGREGSNLRMAESKSAALPLGYAPSGSFGNGRRTAYPRFPPPPPVYRDGRPISTVDRAKSPSRLLSPTLYILRT
jgi:hypothetical protein